MLDAKHKKMIDYALIFNIVLMIIYFLVFVDDNLFFISIMTIFGLTTLNLYNFNISEINFQYRNKNIKKYCKICN